MKEGKDMRTVTIAFVMLSIVGCSRATPKTPRDGLFPMWADTACWSGVGWHDCASRRAALGVPQESFVEGTCASSLAQAR